MSDSISAEPAGLAAPPATGQAGAGSGSGAAAAPAAPGRFYMTSDLRAATGLPRTHLDFYLREGIVRPTARAESGYLLFDEGELATLRAVVRWRQDGVGIRQIRERLGR